MLILIKVDCCHACTCSISSDLRHLQSKATWCCCCYWCWCWCCCCVVVVTVLNKSKKHEKIYKKWDDKFKSTNSRSLVSFTCIFEDAFCRVGIFILFNVNIFAQYVPVILLLNNVLNVLGTGNIWLAVIPFIVHFFVICSL